MTNYRVNLPKTNFAMKANLPKREPLMLEFWNSINLYQSFINPESSKGKFILHDGPPYANGDIHIGHALNKIIKDIINKTKLIDGYSVPYVPGWDCHGLPIELNVEKKIGKAGVKVSVDEFIAQCRKYAASQIELQMASFQRLGVIADWNNFYSTMNYKYEADIVRFLMEIIAAGYVVRGYKPVHWCIACGSALAEAEVEYQDKTSPAIDIRFRVLNPEKLGIKEVSIPVWTTTPWTLPANEAVAVHQDLKYVLVNCATLKEQFILAEELLETVMQRYGEDNYKVEKVYEGAELEGLEIQHPFLDEKKVPLIFGDHVTCDAGTGAVHTAPAHGQEDYKIGLINKLPIKNPVGPNGKFLSSTEFFADQKVFDANPNVVALLKEKGNLIHEEVLQHSYPHCWRHKTPLIFRATQQWFVGMDNAPSGKKSLRAEAPEAIEDVIWIPAQGETSIKSMVEGRPDWCISRQRFWGIPMTLFVHKETGEIHPEMHRLVDEVIAPGIEQGGLTYWHSVEVEIFLKEYAKDSSDSDNYEKVNDTLDVWFNSGVSHYSVLKQRQDLGFPADLYVEGSDQYRGWFQSSLLSSLALNGEAPYKTVITHGFVVDGKGHKMSKSRGNVIKPQQVIDKYGADVLRLWVGSTYLHDDLSASEEIFSRTVDVYRMLRNTARFLIGNLAGFNAQEDLVPASEMLAIDRYAVAKVLELAKSSRKHYDQYQFYSASSNLHVLLGNEISSFYFSVIKDRLYTMPSSSLGRRSAQTALLHILEILVRLLAPITSFTAEEIWQELREMEKSQGISNRKESVFMSSWDNIASESDFDVTQDEITFDDWQEIQNIRDEVNKELEKLRVSGVIGSSLAAEVTLYGDEKVLPVLEKLKDDLRFVLITSLATAEDISAAPKDAIDPQIPGLKLVASPSEHKKCSRCWHFRADVGSSDEHPELCGRCQDNLFGEGEKRFVA